MGEGGKATLVGVPDADILAAAIVIPILIGLQRGLHLLGQSESASRRTSE